MSDETKNPPAEAKVEKPAKAPRKSAAAAVAPAPEAAAPAGKE